MDFLQILLPKNRILILARPNSGKTEILEYREKEDLFVVAVKAPPVDGKANAEIERYFSKTLKKKIRIIGGKRGKRKILEVS